MICDMLGEVVPRSQDDVLNDELARRAETAAKLKGYWKKVKYNFPTEVMDMMAAVAHPYTTRSSQPCKTVDVPILIPETGDSAVSLLRDMILAYNLKPYDAISYYYEQLHDNTYKHESCNAVKHDGPIRHQFSTGCIVIFYKFVWRNLEYKFGILIHRNSNAGKDDLLHRYWNPRAVMREELKEFIDECRQRKMKRLKEKSEK